MDPNDPNNPGSSPPSSPPPAADQGASQEVTLDALYGPSSPTSQSTPTQDTSAAGSPPLPEAPINEPAIPQDTLGAGTTPPVDQPATVEPTIGQEVPPSPDLGYGAPPAGDQQGYPPETPQTAGGAEQFYQDLSPDAQPPVDQPTEVAPPEDYAAGTTNDQLQEQPSYASPEEVQPVDQTEPAMEPGAGGGLPPIPSRSKMPFIILGAVVVIMVLALVVLLGLSRARSTKVVATPTPHASASDIPVTCEEDPQNPDCVQSSPSDSSGSFSPAPNNSGGPLPSLSPQKCQLLYGGPCPQ